MNFSLLPVAIRLSKWNEHQLRKSLNKWIALFVAADRQASRDILLPGIQRCIERLNTNHNSRVEMEKKLALRDEESGS